MEPHSEMVHWLFATGFLFLGLDPARRGDRRRGGLGAPAAGALYLWPSIVFALGVLMWPVMTFFTNSAIHMLAHGAWAQALMVAGAAELGLVAREAAQPLVAARGAGRARRLRASRSSSHEQNPWYFARSAFLHHLIGWTLVVASVLPLGRVAAAALGGVPGRASRSSSSRSR